MRWSLAAKGNPSRIIRGISFNYIGKYNVPSPQEVFQAQKFKHEISACFTLGINRYNNNEYIQLQIEEMYFSSGE